jgi:hypothetical protein
MATRIHGADVLREAAGFLTGMVVSLRQSGFAKGAHVLVQVSSELDEEGNFSLLITCQARGRRRVDWERLSVWARLLGNEETRSIRIAPALDARGQVWLEELERGEYHLSAGTRVEVVEVRQPQLAVRTRGATSGPPGAAAPESAHAAGREAEREYQAVPFHLSADSSIKATAGTGDGGFRVAFETTDPELAGRVVEFTFVTGNQYWEIHRVSLQKIDAAAEQESAFRGTWTRPTPPPAAFDTLLFCLLPPGARPEV